MSNNKLLYEAPLAEALVVRFEGKILQGSKDAPVQNNVFGDDGVAEMDDYSNQSWW